MAKKQCLQCDKPKGLISVNYAGKTVHELGGPAIAGHENYDFTLQGDKQEDYLCSDCASNTEITCTKHGSFKSAMAAGVMKPCSLCAQDKVEEKAEEKAAKQAAAEASREERAAAKEASRIEAAANEAALQEKLKTIPVTTGDVRWDYEIDRVVFNIGASTGALGFIKPSPDAAFRQAEWALKAQAAELGCHAVIHTQFEHRITVTQGIVGPNQGVEVFAYGTAVRRR